MAQKCPLCEQPLPTGITTKQLQYRAGKLALPYLKKDRKQQKQELDKQHKMEIQRVEEQANKKAKIRLKREAAKAEKQTKQLITQAAKTTEKQHAAETKTLEATLKKERARYKVENSQLEGKVDALSRKLEKMGSEQRGDEAEVDLFVKLKSEFPTDRIERVRKGEKGADIIQYVMAGSKEVGCIVYESKNVSDWRNDFVNKAKQYQRKYGTPYVLLVTRAFPRNKKGFCVVKNIPVVEPRFAIPLARVVRDAIDEIGQLRLSHEGSHTKAQKLYKYIIGPEFGTKFQGIADSIKELKDNQETERNNHETAWQEQVVLFNRINSCRREISARIGATTLHDEQLRRGSSTSVRKKGRAR